MSAMLSSDTLRLDPSPEADQLRAEYNSRFESYFGTVQCTNALQAQFDAGVEEYRRLELETLLFALRRYLDVFKEHLDRELADLQSRNILYPTTAPHRRIR